MFEVKNLTIVQNDKTIIENLSFTLNKNDKLAIIGEEGNGKSTLIKTLLGLCDYATHTGSIVSHGYTIGYLAQSMESEHFNKSVFAYLFENENTYYEKISLFYKYLETLQLKEEILKQKLGTLSGGEKVKVGILKLLLLEVDIFILDEPTNDLDIETLEWLEEFINHTEKPILYVSHDETLLSRTANGILHLEQVKHKTECRHTLLHVNYDTYVTNRLQGLEKQTQLAHSEAREYKKQEDKLKKVMQKVEHEQNTISRGNPHGARLLKKKMHALKSQEKKLGTKELTEVPDVEENIHLFFENVALPKTKIILKLELPKLMIEEHVLAKDIQLEVVGNEHVCILGKNGVGKSTLLSKIYEILKERQDIKVGYMPQDYSLVLNEFTYVLDYLCDGDIDKTTARMYLGNLNFTREEMTGKIETLSNGSKAKLILLKLVLSKCNVLLLDEPTRNVSPLSNPVIRESLREFSGCIISVSHDRKYIKEVCDVYYTLTSSGLRQNT